MTLLTFKEEKCYSSHRKQRLTVLLAATMASSEKLKLRVIGKDIQPRWFKANHYIYHPLYQKRLGSPQNYSKHSTQICMSNSQFVHRPRFLTVIRTSYFCCGYYTPLSILNSQFRIIESRRYLGYILTNMPLDFALICTSI